MLKYIFLFQKLVNLSDVSYKADEIITFKNKEFLSKFLKYIKVIKLFLIKVK